MATAKARINVRVSEENLKTIREAADATGQDLTSFVISASLQQAREVLVQSRLVTLTSDEARQLEASLEADPVAIPALTELLSTTLGRKYMPAQALGVVVPR